MQTIGICRFSYPAIGGFQVAHDDVAAREAYLYDPARMKERFALFEALTLPPLRAQTDPDFTFLVVVGDSLPAPYRARLDALLSDMPQAVVRALPPLPHRKAMQGAINAVRKDMDAPCLQFRMDDDDAVAVNFVERLRTIGRDLEALAQRHSTIGIDFCSGFILRVTAQGLRAAPTQEPLSTPALGILIAPGVKQSVMNFAHHNLERAMPVLRFMDEDMMIRGYNTHNDSRQKPTAKRIPLFPVDPEAEALFKDRFDIDANALRRAVSGP